MMLRGARSLARQHHVGQQQSRLCPGVVSKVRDLETIAENNVCIYTQKHIHRYIHTFIHTQDVYLNIQDTPGYFRVFQSFSFQICGNRLGLLKTGDAHTHTCCILVSHEYIEDIFISKFLEK